eukprot:5018177-Pyramimonas_sp.AAC.1
MHVDDKHKEAKELDTDTAQDGDTLVANEHARGEQDDEEAEALLPAEQGGENGGEPSGALTAGETRQMEDQKGDSATPMAECDVSEED